MKIALDYDGTYTADEEMWRKIIYFMACKYEVFVVTSRHEADPIEDAGWFEAHRIPIIYCDYMAKKEVCDNLGIKIDIWIDNDPYWINHSWPNVEAEKWRATRES